MSTLITRPHEQGRVARLAATDKQLEAFLRLVPPPERRLRPARPRPHPVPRCTRPPRRPPPHPEMDPPMSWTLTCTQCGVRTRELYENADHDQTPVTSPSHAETQASHAETQANSSQGGFGLGEGEVRGGSARDSGEPEHATPQPPPIDPGPEPPTDCPKHPGGTERPCRACDEDDPTAYPGPDPHCDCLCHDGVPGGGVR